MTVTLIYPGTTVPPVTVSDTLADRAFIPSGWVAVAGWQVNTPYSAGAVVLAPTDGTVVRAKANTPGRLTYTATDWDPYTAPADPGPPSGLLTNVLLIE